MQIKAAIGWGILATAVQFTLTPIIGLHADASPMAQVDLQVQRKAIFDEAMARGHCELNPRKGRVPDRGLVFDMSQHKYVEIPWDRAWALHERKDPGFPLVAPCFPRAKVKAASD